MSDKTRSDVLVYRLLMIGITRVISTYSPATEEERMVNGSLSMYFGVILNELSISSCREYTVM